MQSYLVRKVRRRMNALILAAQRRPLLSRFLIGLRLIMARYARRFLPRAFDRKELAQARVVMADAPSQPDGATEVLFMTFRAWPMHVAWETTIAQAIRLRGRRCEFFYCGGGLPICEMGWPSQERRRPCQFCAPYVAAMIDAAKFPRVSLDDLVSPSEQKALIATVREESIRNPTAVRVEGVSLLPMIEQSLVWFFRTGTLPDTPAVQRARVDFLAGAAVMVVATRRLLDRISPKVIVMVNGRFYEERIVREIAEARGIRVVSYEVGHQQGTLFFSGKRFSPGADREIEDLWEDSGDQPLSALEERELDAVLHQRAQGTSLPTAYYKKPASFKGKDDKRPLLVLFTNVSWDTAVTGKSYAFSSLFEWIAETIRLAQQHEHIQLVIRIHPAETRLLRLRPTEKIGDLIRDEFPVLPNNVKVVPPEESLDSYSLVEAADAVCVFSSTVGIEAAARGKPVLVCGKSHYRGRGFTIDVEDSEEYGVLFSDLSWVKRDPVKQAKARRYAYSFFCRAMLPFPSVIEDEDSEPVFNFSSVAELAPGNDPMLDLICDGIIHGSPFWLPKKMELSQP